MSHRIRIVHKHNSLACFAVVMSSLALISACGGGGGSSTPSPAQPSPPPPAPAPPPPPPVNGAPTLTTAAVSTDEEVNLAAQLTASDPENNALTFALAAGPQHGTATLTSAGALSYAPTPNFSGADSVTVIVTDSGGAQVTGTLSITVIPVNDAPVVQNDTLRIAVTTGQPIVLTALDNDQDVDGDTLTPSIVSQPRGGTVVVDAPTRQMTFQPANGYRGPIEFTYRVNDGTVDSAVATVRAVIGEFENLLFISDYTTPGLVELHLYDGIDVRRVSDSPLPGVGVTHYSVSGDLRTVAYVVDNTDAERVYVKPLDGSGPAVLRYTSAAKTTNTIHVGAYLNADGSYLRVDDGWYAAKKQFIVDTAAGTVTRVGGAMPGIIDNRFVLFHPVDPHLILVQGQTAGNIPLDTTAAVTAFIADAADASVLTQIGSTYSSGQHGSGEGFYFGTDPRYVYHGEYLRVGGNTVTNLLVYDRQTGVESRLVRNASPPDRGLNGVGTSSPDLSRLCFGYYEPSTTVLDGPSRYYIANTATNATTAVSPVLSDIISCQFAADNRTLIYRKFLPGRVVAQTYSIDSVTPGAPVSLLPAAEVNSKQGSVFAATKSLRAAIAFFDNNGSGSLAGQLGRVYSIPLDGAGEAFQFSDNYVLNPLTSASASNADGSFLYYPRQIANSHYALELMSTHGLNLSIPLSKAGETAGVRGIQWIRRYP